MVEKDFFHEKYALADYLFSSNLTKTQIAKEMDVSLKELNEKLKCYDLEWVTSRSKKMSRGQSAIMQVLQKVLPNERIILEEHLGERLFLDIYIPSYDIGIEYHGRQHYQWTPFFHPTEADFRLAQRRDVRKEELCREKGISLIAFRYNDHLSEESIFARLLEAIRSCPVVESSEPEDEEFNRRHQENLAKARQRQAAIRKEMKARKDLNHEQQQERKEYRKQQRDRRKQQQREYYDQLRLRGGGDDS